MRRILLMIVFLICTTMWSYWKWYDYIDLHGTCYLSLTENRLVLNEPGGVAVFRQTVPGTIGPRLLVLQRPILHVNGHQSYSEGLMLYLDDPDYSDSTGVFRTVLADNGVALCVRDASRNGGYSLRLIDSLPEELLAVRFDGTDTLHFPLDRQLQPFRAEAPAIAWWAEPWKILTSP
ncbi:MAG: hypothetical protein KA791_03280 [Flavobacteriales bacterium]|nr:hypothetical protein [Flavobacteriales bacterium]